MLTFEEFKEYTGQADVSEDDFETYSTRSKDIIGQVTGHFYAFHDFETDFEFRKMQYKKAIAYQTLFLISNETTTSDGLATPQSFSVGRTTVNMSSGSGKSNKKAKTIVSDDALAYLESTGLLYRGVYR